jgi:hypothetical protein
MPSSQVIKKIKINTPGPTGVAGHLLLLLLLLLLLFIFFFFFKTWDGAFWKKEEEEEVKMVELQKNGSLGGCIAKIET